MPRPRKNPYQQSPEPVPDNRNPVPPPERPPASAHLARLGAIGTDFALAVVISGILGWLADKALGTSPWLLMASLLVGIIAGFIRFVRSALAESRRP